MIPLTITPDITKTPWTEMTNPDVAVLGLGEIVKVGRLTRGTTSGRAAIMIQIRLPDGKLAVGQTTLRLMRGAMQAVEALEARDGRGED